MTSVVSENQIDDEEIKLDKSKKQPTIETTRAARAGEQTYIYY